jgi:hypothetical protein
MKQQPKYGNCVCFFIKDPNGMVWGLSLSMLDARQQAAWHLPKGIKYTIEPGVMPRNIPIDMKDKNDE